MKRRWQLAIVLILSIIALVACNNDKAKEQDQGIPNQMEQVEPDLTGVPDTVAEVNGSEISREKFERTYLSQFQQAAFDVQMAGETFDQEEFKRELVESMIDLELLIQEADRREFIATDQAVDEMVTLLAEDNSLESEDVLYEIYEEQGMSRDQLREELTQQIKLDQLISDQSEGLTISEDQIIELYEELLVIYEEIEQEGELPSMEELRGDLETQIRYQGENQLIMELIEQLRGESEIINYMS